MTLHLVTRRFGAELDWAVELDDDATLADLAAIVGLDPTTGELLVDGRTVAHATIAADASLGHGTVLEVRADTGTGGALPRLGALPSGTPSVEVQQIGGLAAGRVVALPGGRFDLGGAMAAASGLHAGPVGDRAACLAVDGTGAHLLPGARGVRVNGGAVPAAGLALGSGHVIDVGTAILRVAGARPRTGRRVLADERGLCSVHRPPRRPVAAPAAAPVAPVRPDEPRPPAPLSWATLLGPLPIAIAMALLLSPRFALLGAAGPLLALGRWWEARRRHRRHVRRHHDDIQRLVAGFVAEVQHAADDERQRRWLAHPDPVQLARTVDHGDARLWERRGAHDDALVLTVGTGTVDWLGPRIAARFPELTPALAEHGALRAVPATVPLAQRHAIGIAGSPAATAAVARWLVLQTAVLHGPADVALAAAVPTSHQQGAWEWLKWLPQLTDRSGARRVAGTTDEVAALAAALGEEVPVAPRSASAHRPVGRFGLVIVTDPTFARVAALRDLATRVGSMVRAVVTAPTVEQLPAWCDVVVEVGDDGTATVVDHRGDEVVGDVVATGLGLATATTMARNLSLFDDPESTGASSLPDHVELVGLLGLDDVIDDPPALAARLTRRWHQADTAALTAPVGATEHGALALDLVHDGPHGLVAGTTGAGKSELLRSLVASIAASTSPDDVNIVLIDFKGGGAFDACGELPHTVAVVTDLDAHLGARALRCLRAEVRYREGLLRAEGASDLATYAAGRPAEPLPRLLVVIDEFATLAAELPEFLTSVVDIAQRGRSLGIHLLLATQRPSGVIDNKVRANTNLRIALRVQDDGDSLDVVGCTDAARLSRRTPGRALARFGSSDLTTFQTTLVTTRPDRSRHRPLVAAHPFSLADDHRGSGGTGSSVTSTGTGTGTGTSVTGTRAAECPSDLERLVAAARTAARDNGCRPPRIPWPAPLPAAIDAVDLWAGPPTAPWTVTLGLLDEPDEQRQRPWSWRAADGNLAVFGANPLDTANVLATTALGLASAHGPDQAHLYVVDGGTGALAALAELPHCGAVVHGGDTARVARAFEVLGDELDRRRALVRHHRLSGIDADTIIEGRRVPLVVLVVENAGAVLDALDADGERDAPARFVQLVRDGAALGMCVVLSVPHERALPGRVTGLLPQRLVLKMSESVSYLALGLVPRDMPVLDGLRGVVAGTGHEVQIAAVASVAEYARATAAQHTGPSPAGPAPVRTLGARVELVDVQEVGRLDPDRWTLVVGATPSLRPVELELPTGIHAIVSGPPGSGKSTALVTVAHAAMAASGGDVALIAVAARRSPLERLGLGARVVADADALAAALTAAGDDRTLVLVDDAELLSGPLAAALGQLADGRHDHLRIVAAGRGDQLRSLQSWVAPLRHGRTGIALQPSPADGDVFKTSLPVRASMVFGPGRGYVVQLGTPRLAQVAVSA